MSTGKKTPIERERAREGGERETDGARERDTDRQRLGAEESPCFVLLD